MPNRCLNVICVYRAGGDFGAEDVHNLHAQVARHLHMPHTFLCLTDTEGQVQAPTKQFAYDWPGWWSKVEALGAIGPCLYMDLDTVVTGDITALGQGVVQLHPHEFMMLRGVWGGGYASGIMGWSMSAGKIMTRFVHELQRARSVTWPKEGVYGHRRNLDGSEVRGDQQWIYRTATRLRAPIRLAQEFEPRIVSYHKDAKRALPNDTRIVCFHGPPRPRQVSPMPAWLQEALTEC